MTSASCSPRKLAPARVVLLVAGWSFIAAAQPALVEVPFGRSEAEVAPGVPFVTEPKTGEETTLSRAGATLLGLFLLLFLIASAATSWCAKCHSFSMKQTGRSVSGSTDYSPSPLSVDYRENVSFSFQCSKCGHQKTDRYDGFWSPKRH